MIRHCGLLLQGISEITDPTAIDFRSLDGSDDPAVKTPPVSSLLRLNLRPYSPQLTRRDLKMRKPHVEPEAIGLTRKGGFVVAVVSGSWSTKPLQLHKGPA